MPDTRVPVLATGHVLRHSLLFTEKIKADNGRGELPPLLNSKTTLTQDFRNTSRLSCNVKAFDGNPTSRPSPHPASSISLLCSMPTGPSASRICNHKGPSSFCLA